MPESPKTRQSLENILMSCSDTLFPAESGEAPVSVKSCDVDGDTALHVMLWRGDNYAVLRLIEAGADVNAIGDMSETPLHVAIRKHNIFAIEALLKAGATSTQVSEFGKSPQGLAKEMGGEISKLFR